MTSWLLEIPRNSLYVAALYNYKLGSDPQSWRSVNKSGYDRVHISVGHSNRWAMKSCHNLKCNCGVFAPIQECMSNKWNRSRFGLGMIATNGGILGLLLVCAWLCSSDGRTLKLNTYRDMGSNPVKAWIVSGFFLWNWAFQGQYKHILNEQCE